MQVLHTLNNNQCSTSPKTKVQNVQEQKDLFLFSIFSLKSLKVSWLRVLKKVMFYPVLTTSPGLVTLLHMPHQGFDKPINK